MSEKYKGYDLPEPVKLPDGTPGLAGKYEVKLRGDSATLTFWGDTPEIALANAKGYCDIFPRQEQPGSDTNS